MIDRRNISYTQGNPSTPIHQGALVRTPVDQFKKKKRTQYYSRGDVVSRVATHEDEAGAGIPSAITDVVTKGSFFTGIDAVTNFWNLIFGTPEGKMKALKPYLPIDDTGHNIWDDTIKKIKESEDSEWFEEPIVTVPFIEPFKFEPFKGFADIGKWLLLGGVAIGGIYIAGKLIGRKR